MSKVVPRRAVRAPGIGLVVLALALTGHGTTPDAHASQGTPVMEGRVLSESELVAWFHDSKPTEVCNDSSWEDGVWTCHEWVPYEFRAGDGAVTVRQLVRYYLEEGANERVTGDIAFMQAILETAWFFYPDSGQVRTYDNNFGGMGAFDSGKHQPFRFPDVRTGVRAQMQHLRLYADPTTALDGSNLGSPLAQDVDDRYPDRWRTVRNITEDGEYVYAGQAPDWEDFGDGMWATDPVYSGKILNNYHDALAYNGYATNTATAAARACPSASTSGGSHIGASGEIVTVEPARLLDTRNSSQGPQGKVEARSTLTLPVLGQGGIPSSDVDAVVANVTALEATQQSFLTVWPGGTDRPGTSTMNPQPNRLTSNEVIVPVGADGTINLYNHSGSIHSLVDVVGYVPANSSYATVEPTRLLDTRGHTPWPRGATGPRGTCNLEVAGVGGVPSSATSVVVNVTTLDATQQSFVTVWPAGTDRPGTSTMNPQPGRLTSNEVIVPVGANGTINLYNHSGSVRTLVDVVGYLE